jgi:hypothetical protein
MMGRAPGVITGVEVWRGVLVALGVAVLACVQVGSKVKRNVGVAGIALGGTAVGVARGVTALHPASTTAPQRMIIFSLTACLSSAY